MPARTEPEAVRFCWYCAGRVPDQRRTAPHYETGRPVYFCSDEHWGFYTQLACL